MEVKDLKKAAADKAVEFVRSGMVLGLGGGSTAALAIKRIGELYREGELEDICGVPCSTKVESIARDHGVPLTTLDDEPVIDLTIDGADEVDDDLNLVKGGGGALVWEKIVAQASRREIIIVDESKLSRTLGTCHPVPVEVLYFGLETHRRFLEGLGAETDIRTGDAGQTYVTDSGNYLFDCDFGPIEEPGRLGNRMKARSGVIDHGLFVDYADDVIVAGADGLRHLHNES